MMDIFLYWRECWRSKEDFFVNTLQIFTQKSKVPVFKSDRNAMRQNLSCTDIYLGLEINLFLPETFIKHNNKQLFLGTNI